MICNCRVQKSALKSQQHLTCSNQLSKVWTSCDHVHQIIILNIKSSWNYIFTAKKVSKYVSINIISFWIQHSSFQTHSHKIDTNDAFHPIHFSTVIPSADGGPSARNNVQPQRLPTWPHNAQWHTCQFSVFPRWRAWVAHENAQRRS